MGQKREGGRASWRGAATGGSPDAIGGALLLAALLQAQAARGEGLDARAILAKLSDTHALTDDEVGLLQLAVAIEAPHLLTAVELAAVLDPQALIDLGLAPELVADLLDDGPMVALQRLKLAFAGKLKAALASAERKAFGDEAQLFKAAAQSEGGDAAAEAAAGGSSAAGLSPLALLAGVAGLGAVGVALGGDGGSSGRSGANVNDAPTAATDTVAATEDAAVTFDVRTNDSDVDGDALAVTAINGVAISSATPVTLAGIGTVALNANGTLTFNPLANFNGAPSFTYTLSDGRGGTATGTVNLAVAPVNDAPVNSLPAAAPGATQGSALPVAGVTVADVDGGALTTTLSLAAGQGTLAIGAVAGGAAVTGSGSASVVLTGTAAQINASLAALSYTSSATFSGAAQLTVSTSDGALTDTDTLAINVARVQSGVVSDGYVAGGTVFIDVNGNGRLDPGEPSTTTRADGSYAFATNAVGPVVAFGGTNIDTGLPNLVTLTAPAGSTVVNPLTTVVQALVASGVSAATANAQVTAALGLPAGTNLASYDILAKPATDPVALAAQKAATQIVTLLNTARDAAGATNASSVEAAIVAKIAAAVGGGTTIDLGSTAMLSSLLTGVTGLPAGAVSSTVAKTAAINQVIAKAGDLGAISDLVIATSKPNANLAPATTPDAVATTRGQPVTFDVRTNDVDPEGAALKVTAINGTALQAGVPVTVTGGAITLNANGTLTFTPTMTFVGTPSFTYTLSDGVNSSAGTINLSVTAPSSTLNVAPADFAGVVANAATLAGQGVLEIDVGGPGTIGALTITEAQAATLIGAGLELAVEDDITLSAAATHLSNNLQSLQALGVDTIAVASALTAVDIDAGGLAGLLGTPLPQFDATRTDASLDVTLNVLGSAGTDLFAGVTESLATIAALGSAGIDHLDVNGAAMLGSTEISDAQAAALVAAGIDFADGDSITVEAAGTQLSTSLGDLQSLGVDVVAAAGVAQLSVAVGAAGIDGLAALPQFDVAQSDGALDVTLEIDALALASEVDVGTLLGVDVLAGVTTPDLYGALIDALTDAGIDRIEISAAGRVELTDGLADVLGDLDGFAAPAADLVLDATGSGDRLLTSLREMADLGVDSVELSDQGSDPVYVDLSDGPTEAGELLALLDTLDSDGDDATALFSGSSELSLVVDQATAEVIAQTSGALDKLVELGFTQVAVLDGVNNSSIMTLETAFDVTLIGQGDPLYDYLSN